MFPTSEYTHSVPHDITRVAVIGTGPAGLIAIKVLSEDGFKVRAFESKDVVGGIW